MRNVRNGELGTRLRDEGGVAAWVDPSQLEGARRACPEGVALEGLEPFDPMRDPALGVLLERSTWSRRSTYDPRSCRFWWGTATSRRLHDRPARRAAALARCAVKTAIHHLVGRIGTPQVLRRRVSEALRKHPISEAYRRRFSDVGATVVASFSPEAHRESPLIEAARAAGLPTVVMIRSRDNLATKIAHLPDADAYLVWADATRDYMRRMYPEIPDERIHVTGSPQFDRHLDPAFRLDRRTFFRTIDLDPDRPLVVYTLACPELIPHEVEIAQALAEAAHEGRLARGAQLLVRGHPRTFGSDAPCLLREYPEARVWPRPTDRPYRGPAHESEVVRLTLEDEPMHLATLAYQDVQVNVCGTMTIDSAIHDKPVVHVYYDQVAGVPRGSSTRSFYDRSDVIQMLGYGCSRPAHSHDHCIDLINAYLLDRTLDSAGRRKAREEDCGPLDGRAGERIAAILAAATKIEPLGVDR